MKIRVKCFATLAGHTPGDGENYPVPEGETVASLMERLGLRPEDVNLMFVNSERAYPETPLKDGDRVGLFPAVGGG